ncbi:MAG: ABC transporter permease [Clostridiales bacterium]|nr:ABC transporter permease [Clostridiales bacterium]MDY3747697.1 ABC transporter permease [Lachnospiraceae bacterium]
MKRSKVKLILVLFCVALLWLTAFMAPYMTRWDPYEADMAQILLKPGSGHILGTDELGRDVFSRILAGLKISLLSATAVAVSAFIIGTSAGTLAGYFGGITDKIVMWLITAFQVFPGFLLAIVVAGVLGSGIINACIALTAVYWTTLARLSRGFVISMKSKEYIQAVNALGSGHFRIIMKHMLPNMLGQLLAASTSQIGSIILSMAGLSFLGLGAKRPTAEWGIMVSEAQAKIRTAPGLVLFISGAIVIVVLVFNLLGDVLRDYFDKKYD